MPSRLSPEELARVADWISTQAKPTVKPVRRRAPVATVEKDIEDPMLRSLVEGVGNAAEAATLPNQSQRLTEAIRATGKAPDIETPNIEALAPRQQALEQLAAPMPPPSMPTSMPQDEELESMRELMAVQSAAQRGESILPFIQAAQTINAAWTGAPVDVGTLRSISQGLRAKEADAQTRLAAAQQFARRRMAGEQATADRQASQEALQQRLSAEERMMGARLAASKEAQDIENALRARELQLREFGLAAQMQREGRRGAGTVARPADAMKQEEQALKMEKLRQDVEKSRAEAAGERTPAEKKKARETMVEIREREANIQKSLSELENLVKKEGTFSLTGPAEKMMRKLMYDIAIDTAKLMDPGSVAREGEVEAVRKNALFEPGLGIANDTALTLINNFKKSTNDRLQTAFRIRGIRPEDVEAAPTKKTGVEFPLKVRHRATGKERVVTTPEELNALKPFAADFDVME